jgi:membrane protein YdbS with pleckstrin-like domain
MSNDRNVLSASGSASAPGPNSHEGEELLFEGHPSLIPSLGALLAVVFTLGLWLLPSWWRSRSRHYRLTTRRVVIESGILNKRLEQVDLYRVSDYTVVRPFSQRVLGTGNLILRTLDKSSPIVPIEGIKADVVALYERVRAATETEKTKRGAVRLMELE